MKLPSDLPLLLVTFVVFVSSSTDVSGRRSKRDLTDSFREKHVTFVSEGTAITFEFLKNKLPNYANTEDRTKHTFIIVILNNAEEEGKQIMAFWAKLNSVMSKKIKSNTNICRKKEPKYPHICITKKSKKISKSEKVSFKLSGYRLCTFNLSKDLGPNACMANFNPQDKKSFCKYSHEGVFDLGGGIVQNKNTGDKTDWFIVNHLEKSHLYGTVMDCKKQTKEK